MKKFILSATLALACFTAQAKNEVIKNDDDKNPKSKAKVVKVIPQKSCSKSVAVNIYCADGSQSLGFGDATAGSCGAAGLAAYYLAMAEATIGCSY